MCRNAPELVPELASEDGRTAQTTFFCPLHCLHLAVTPYCGAKGDTTARVDGGGGGVLAPCRVALIVVSDFDRLSARLADLEASWDRAVLQGDQGRLASVSQQIKLVKFERRRAKNQNHLR